MSINYLRAGALFGLLAVAIGAFGAHGLKQIVEAPQIAIFETGVRYQFYHALALIALGLLMLHLPNNHLRMAGRLFIVGIICFSGSIYLLAVKDVFLPSGFEKIIGPITPIGGLMLIAGWFFFYLGIGKRG
ncbi:MAG TPA: DUF423 domain-containing protein [Phaeodactylibacter sp.]|nr:DUF423 domain-containing protein [Phaeodactylibacter sp.]